MAESATEQEQAAGTVTKKMRRSSMQRGRRSLVSAGQSEEGEVDDVMRSEAMKDPRVRDNVEKIRDYAEGTKIVRKEIAQWEDVLRQEKDAVKRVEEQDQNEDKEELLKGISLEDRHFLNARRSREDLQKEIEDYKNTMMMKLKELEVYESLLEEVTEKLRVSVEERVDSFARGANLVQKKGVNESNEDERELQTLEEMPE